MVDLNNHMQFCNTNVPSEFTNTYTYGETKTPWPTTVFTNTSVCGGFNYAISSTLVPELKSQ
jgi:hypothetical protein